LFLFCCNFKLCSFLFAVISSQQTLTVKRSLSLKGLAVWTWAHSNALTLKCDAVQRSAIMQDVDTEYLSYKVLTTLPPPLHDDVHVRWLKSTVIGHDIPTAKSKAILLYKSLSQTHTDTHTQQDKNN
jgi:hypothetical protein